MPQASRHVDPPMVVELRMATVEEVRRAIVDDGHD